jgi:hypothetical protein
MAAAAPPLGLDTSGMPSVEVSAPSSAAAGEDGERNEVQFVEFSKWSTSSQESTESDVPVGDAVVFLARDVGSSEIAAPEIPPLHEKWCWEGDTSILPVKWQSIMVASFGRYAHTRRYLRAECMSKPQWDPEGFFFLTHRFVVCYQW